MTLALPQSPSQHTVFLRFVSWNTFNLLLTELGNQRSQRLSYDQGILEIMTPLGIHENNNRFIESLILIIADELDFNLKKFGSLTLKSSQYQQGVEPDSCYYIAQEPRVRNHQNIDLTIDPPPDLVLEIDITNTSLNKLPIYANLGVPEVWRYDGRNLNVFVLDQENKQYQTVGQSQAFPFLDIQLIPRLMQRSLEIGETATLKQFRQWLREKSPAIA
jgi:Uma2 family endonuclease